HFLGRSRWKRLHSHWKEAPDRPPSLASRPVLTLAPPLRVDHPVVADDEQIELIAVSRDGRHRGSQREYSANRFPVVVHTRPVPSRRPPGRVHIAIVARDKEIELV